ALRTERKMLRQDVVRPPSRTPGVEAARRRNRNVLPRKTMVFLVIGVRGLPVRPVLTDALPRAQDVP
ncbi:MAG TPA: hypothetical protein VHG08_12190, partial [Longimicrobium sp.]|nr:hypothetical protein [Longimicrobium sp.]